MKETFFYGTHCFKLSEKETGKMIDNKKGVFIESLSLKYPNSKMYKYKIFGLNDSSYLYELSAGGGYLFSNRDNLAQFIAVSEAEERKMNLKYERFRDKEMFIDETGIYINSFLKKHSVTLNFHNVKDLSVIDNMINNGSIKIEDDYYSLVAIIGEYHIENIKEAKWVNYTLGQLYPTVQNKTMLFSPIDILEETLMRLEKKKKSSLYNLVRSGISKVY